MRKMGNTMTDQTATRSSVTGLLIVTTIYEDHLKTDEPVESLIGTSISEWSVIYSSPRRILTHSMLRSFGGPIADMDLNEEFDRMSLRRILPNALLRISIPCTKFVYI
jgi:hypothetical protein